MARGGIDLEPSLDVLNSVILKRPVAVILAFLLVTALFSGGVGMITGEEDETEAFTDDIEALDAFERINDEFQSPFSRSTAQTSLIHSGSDVLTREELVRNLRILEQADERAELRVDSATGPAVIIAQTIDPSAERPESQRRAVERASDTEIRSAIRENSDNPAFTQTLSDDFNAESASASASITPITHTFPPEGDDAEEVQQGIQSLADRSSGEFRVLGEGLTNAETQNVTGDSLTIVMPVVIGLILLFLIIAYRDPFDLMLGLIALLMTLIWTFGFLGYTGIPFDQQMIAVPILLLAVGIDFGIHIVNRYREERAKGYDALQSMTNANSQLAVAFAIVTVTTIFGFGANLTSDLTPTQNFGLVASAGIFFTFLIFGVFLPAAKIFTDNQRERFGVRSFGTKPLATKTSILGRLLPKSVTISKRAPVLVVLLILVVSAGAVGYGQGVDRTFDEQDFLPPEEIPAYIEGLPEPFAPSQYTVTETLNFVEDTFDASQDDQVTMYIQGPFEREDSLESVHRTTEDPPDTYVQTDGRASTTSIITVIDDHAERDPEFAALVERNDRSGNGVPDRNLDRIYDELLASAAGPQAERYLTDDRRAIRVEFDVDADATQEEITADSREYADDFRYAATATGFIIVFESVTEIIFDSAIESLALAAVLSAVFLILVYWMLARRPLLGLVNVFPILVAVAILLATMRAVGLALNAITATILSITIGVGIAYSVHVIHRFIDEYTDGKDAEESLIVTLRGTGGALTGSMLTTSIGTGSLVLSISPILGDFGLLLAVSVFYSYLTAVLVLPATIFLWARWDNGARTPRALLWPSSMSSSTPAAGEPADD